MPSSVAKHTIPPFYACYFLRSLSSPGTTYIGSTPAPPRRKRQHNGDLTQGAYKTARARPWEMECIVYGFSSKIAALQFEWAWAKPHLSRHLKFLSTEYTADKTRMESTSAVGLPLFPSTSMTPGQTRWGKPKRRMARAPSTPNLRLLTMRALLRSEPFCGWGLKLAFFTEWTWLAYQRLENAAQASAERLQPSTDAQHSLQVIRRSRSGKPLHPLYPIAVCDFTGVDGKRTPLVQLPTQDLAYAGVVEQPVKKRQSSSKARAGATEEAPHWPETLPRSANLKGLDACIQDFDHFPSPPPSIPNTDLTRKAKRITKASKEAIIDDEEELLEGDDAEAEGRAIESTKAIDDTRVMHRMRFEDLDAEEAEWSRLEHTIASRLYSATAEPKQAMSDFMQTSVQRHVAAQDTRTLDAAPPAPTIPCALCNEPLDLTNQLDFALCPEPPSNTLANMASESHVCSSIFHLSCLADSFLNQQHANGLPEEDVHCTTNTILPTHGVCPCHTVTEADNSKNTNVALWADVVRGMYRRKERFERLVEFLARSGRTLMEHLNPPEPLPASPRKKKTSKSQAPSKVASEEVGLEETDAGDAVKKVKASATRKRQAATGVAEEAPERAQEQAIGSGTASGTKRRVSRKTQAVADPIDVIDLT